MHRSPSEMVIQQRETIGEVPPQLEGASTTLTGSKLYMFGGSLASASEPRLLSTLFELDLDICKWERIKPSEGEFVQLPEARYFHTTDIWRNYLVVFGGLGDRGVSTRPDRLRVLNDVRLFDLSTRHWLPPITHNSIPSPGSTDTPRPRYAHLSCVTSDYLVIIGGKDFFEEGLDDICVYDLVKQEWIRTHPCVPPLDTNHAFAGTSLWHVRRESVGPAHLPPLPYSDPTTTEHPHDIYLYNGEPRKLDIFSPSSTGEIQPKDPAPGQPPGLRCPSGGILGNTLIISGNSNDHCKLWAYDLVHKTWSHLDTGDFLSGSNGPWAKGYLWHAQNKFILFKGASSDGPLNPNCKVITFVDLEALGIYQPPTRELTFVEEKRRLEALGTGEMDFEFICDDGRKIPCSKKVVLERWPWFKEQLELLPGILLPRYDGAPSILYTLTLGTSLQRAPAVLSHLLLISSADANHPESHGGIAHLQSLVKHAMHLALSESAVTAAGVYEISASCGGCRSLQIRAFRISRENKKKKSRSKSPAAGIRGRARSNSEGKPSLKALQEDDSGLPSSAFTRPLAAPKGRRPLPASIASTRLPQWSRVEEEIPRRSSITGLGLFYGPTAEETITVGRFAYSTTFIAERGWYWYTIISRRVPSRRRDNAATAGDNGDYCVTQVVSPFAKGKEEKGTHRLSWHHKLSPCPDCDYPANEDADPGEQAQVSGQLVTRKDFVLEEAAKGGGVSVIEGAAVCGALGDVGRARVGWG
ncbi:hypothetical protein FB45DRAFT_1062001 [Roridomyces roridus]|uniref:Uncharacterized protein n=1 Tax=Roridomyces roridus TaxID=1738132 RepID=A0AAD7BGZ9_9AGAR|nr:hypothetical protein FB45DRAFT_1062001 [Roridomyces roridus]